MKMRVYAVSLALALSVFLGSVNAQTQTPGQVLAQTAQELQDIANRLLVLKGQLESPAPVTVNEVVSDWELLPANIGQESECQPNNFTHRAELWTKRTLIPASNGGLPYTGPREDPRVNSQVTSCVYVAPVGKIVYLIEIGDHDHSFNDVPSMQAWVPTSGAAIAASFPGGNPPSKIEWETISGWKRFAFPTYTEFKAYIAAFTPETEAPPLPPDANPEWTRGAKCGVQTLTDGNPQPVLWSAQWHHNDIFDITDRATTHMHLEPQLPPPTAAHKGKLKIPITLQFFHWQGAKVRDLQITFPGFPDKTISIEQEVGGEHLLPFCATVEYDTEKLKWDGKTTIIFRLRLTNPTAEGHNDHFVTFFSGVNLANGGGRPVESHGWEFTAVGWMTKTTRQADGSLRETSEIGYMDLRLGTWHLFEPDANPGWNVRTNPADPWNGWFIAGSGPGIGIENPFKLSAFKNPDLHAHPPLIGTALPDHLGRPALDIVYTSTKGGRLFIADAGSVVTDRFMFRNLRTDIGVGASATLLGVTLR